MPALQLLKRARLFFHFYTRCRYLRYIDTHTYFGFIRVRREKYRFVPTRKSHGYIDGCLSLDLRTRAEIRAVDSVLKSPTHEKENDY